MWMLVIFTRWPRAGHTKTRLIPALDPRVPLAMLEILWDVDTPAAAYRATGSSVISI
jgi:hypothetical protein